MDEIKVYETHPESSEDEQISSSQVLNTNEEIKFEYVPMETAISQLDSIAHETDPIEARIARIRKEIKAISEINELEGQNLVSELRNSLKLEPSPHTQPTPESLPNTLASPQELQNLELRVYKLESVLGSSTYTDKQPLKSKLTHLTKMLDLLALNPNEMRANADSIALEAEKTKKIDYLYSKLQNVDHIMHAIPQINSRLQTLRYLHAQQLNSAENEANLSKGYEAIKSEMQQWRECLEKLEARS